MPSALEHFHRELARLASEGAHSEHIARRAVLVWRKLDAVLSPIIGHGGVAALFKRSVSMTSPTYSWLASIQGALDPADGFNSIQAALSQQASADAAAANSAVLQKFIDILTSLIGESLAERLLSTIWADGSNDDARDP